MKKVDCLTLLMLSMLLWSGIAAAVPSTLGYRGRMNDASGNPMNAAVSVTFSLYGENAYGSPLWSESQMVTVQNGVFNVVLGASNGIPSSVVSQSNLYLGIQVGSDAEMTPRQKLNSSVFAMKAGTADTAGNSAPSTATIVDGAITGTKIANGAITSSAIADASVTDVKIASVSSGKVTGVLADSSLSSNVMLSNNSQAISGSKTFSAPIISNVATGVAPLQIASQTMVQNLNADLLEGQHAGDIIAAAKDEKRTPISSLPYTITASGSYYLTQSYTVNGSGIVVNADNVSIDLNGFTITGNGSGDGIFMSGRSNIEVKNGTVSGFGYGIHEYSSLGQGHRIISVRSIKSAQDGINLANSRNLIKDCTVSLNSQSGLVAYTDANTVIDTVASLNHQYGIYLGALSKAINNTVRSNYWTGIYVGNSSVVTGNIASWNSQNGINAGNGCLVTGNIAFNNSIGIHTLVDCTIQDNTAYNNSSSGMDLGNYCLVVHNTAYHNHLLGLPSTYDIWAGTTGGLYKENAAPD